MQFVRGEIFNVNVSFTVFYDSPQTQTDLFVTVGKEVLRLVSGDVFFLRKIPLSSKLENPPVNIKIILGTTKMPDYRRKPPNPHKLNP